MKIDLNHLEDGAWVDYKDGAEVFIRPLSTSKQAELRRMATTKRVKFVAGRRETVEEIDDQKYEELLRDWVVGDWRGIKDQADQAIPCTAEMKTLLLDHFHDLRSLALETALDLQNEKLRQQQKNSRD